MKKRIIIALITIISLFFLSGCNENSQPNENDITNINSLKEFNKCLADNGVVIYGTVFCPACNALVENLGGYEKVKPIYVECSEEEERCREETKTIYVPEIQINGEVYEGSRSLEALSQLTGCDLP